MKTSIKTVCALALGALVFLLLNGCETTSAEDLRGPVEITVGMSSADVLLRLGEPSRVKEREIDGNLLEVWAYDYTRQNYVELRQTGTREVPYIDPITGQMRMVPEPELMPEITRIIDTIEIFFDQERVVTWDQRRKQSRDLIQ